MKPMSAAVFDLDGVLLDSESDLSWLQRASVRTLEYFDIDTEEFTELLYSKHVPNFLKISTRLGVDPHILWPVRNRIYTEEKVDAMKHRVITPFSDVSRLYDLKPSFEMGIVSNSPQSVVDFFIQEFEYGDLFQFGIGRGDGLKDIEKMKPHPFLFSLLRKQVRSDHIFYIGDAETDRLFAENTGMLYLSLKREEDVDSSFSSLNEIVSYLLSLVKG
jgi:phosphoglycolate phosphatase